VGAALAAFQKKWTTLYLAAWCAAAYLVLVFHVPVFYHHQHLITIPAAMLAGIPLGEAGRLLFDSLRTQAVFRLQTAAALALLAAGYAAALPHWRAAHMAFILPPDQIEPAAPRNGREEEFLEAIQQRAGQTHWMVTDLPIFAFRAGLPVPPSLAVISRKRLASGDLTEEKIRGMIETYHPEQVLMGRFDLPALENYLEEEYQLVKTWGKKRLYMLDRLEASP
jgi:hypothetical protein